MQVGNVTFTAKAANDPIETCIDSIDSDETGTINFTITPAALPGVPRLFARDLKLNLVEPHEAPSAVLKEAGKLNPTVLETFKVASCLAEFLPLAGKVLHVGTHTIEILDAVKSTVGNTTTVFGILQDGPTGNISVAELTIVGQIGLSAIPFESCGELFLDYFFQPLPPQTIKPPIIPVPVPTPLPPTGSAS